MTLTLIAESPRIASILSDVREELQRAILKYPRMNTPHEGYAILLEEVDELWEMIRLKQGTPGRESLIREEAIQVAAMAVRLVLDCCDKEESR